MWAGWHLVLTNISAVMSVMGTVPSLVSRVKNQMSEVAMRDIPKTDPHTEDTSSSSSVNYVKQGYEGVNKKRTYCHSVLKLGKEATN